VPFHGFVHACDVLTDQEMSSLITMRRTIGMMRVMYVSNFDSRLVYIRGVNEPSCTRAR